MTRFEHLTKDTETLARFIETTAAICLGTADFIDIERRKKWLEEEVPERKGNDHGV